MLRIRFRSPLEWAFASRKIDIARLLLERGTRVDHISAKGWTPVFNLFGYEYLHGMQQPSCIEYLQLLSAAGFSDWDIQDNMGWSVMHGAAFYGTAEDISALVNVGASVKIVNSRDQTPLRLAVIRKNTDTFTELAKHLPSSFIDEQDQRGWTLLHEAARIGDLEMLNLIFQYNPNPHIATFKTALNVPSDLVQMSLAPVDIARHQGEDCFKVFVEALVLAGHDVAVAHGSKEDDKEDLFWSLPLEEFH
jgi:ankyrin repeat protein